MNSSLDRLLGILWAGETRECRHGLVAKHLPFDLTTASLCCVNESFGPDHLVRPFLLPRPSNEGLLENRSVNKSGSQELKYAMSAGSVSSSQHPVGFLKCPPQVALWCVLIAMPSWRRLSSRVRFRHNCEIVRITFVGLSTPLERGCPFWEDNHSRHPDLRSLGLL